MAAKILHGGGLIAARRRFPHAPEPWIDLSTGINPHAYPCGVVSADALRTTNRFMIGWMPPKRLFAIFAIAHCDITLKVSLRRSGCLVPRSATAKGN